ncbi:MAG: hypothetical protein WBQ34_06960 [Candidatus Acidiferrales bacterium]
MFQSPRSRKVGTVAALVISWSAVYWLYSLLPPLKHDILFRIGFLSATMCALGGLTFFWGVLLSHIARHRKWSPRTCHKAGLSILVPFAGLCFAVSRDQFFVILEFEGAVCLATFVGYVCRKLAYPGLTDDEAYAPEPPLTLFPK